MYADFSSDWLLDPMVAGPDGTSFKLVSIFLKSYMRRRLASMKTRYPKIEFSDRQNGSIAHLFRYERPMYVDSPSLYRKVAYIKPNAQFRKVGED